MKKQTKQLKVIKEFPYNPIGSWTNVNPFAIVFVYPQKGEPVIVKGGLNDVDAYIRQHYPVAIVNIQMFHKKSRRGYYKVYGERKGVNINFIGRTIPRKAKEWASAKTGHRKYVSAYDKNDPTLQLKKYVRHFPRCWMKELNPFVVNNACNP